MLKIVSGWRGERPITPRICGTSAWKMRGARWPMNRIGSMGKKHRSPSYPDLTAIGSWAGAAQPVISQEGAGRPIVGTIAVRAPGLIGLRSHDDTLRRVIIRNRSAAEY